MKTIKNLFRLRTGQTKTGNYKKTFLLLLIVWFIINLIQAVFTEVLSDEAYYGLFSKYLDWGYFDHPPMVALMIKISSLVFNGNLGIRFLTILLQLGTIILIWKIIGFKEPDSHKVTIFFIIAGSISLFSVFGVLTSPDSPLLFFTALFFFAYKKFLKDADWRSVLLMAISMAGLVYSKYQAVLVIGFVILSNPGLLKTYRFWLAGVLALIFLLPHIYWQVSNDFPSFKYHLADRSEGFKWAFLFEYLPNQMAVFNPLTLGAAIYVLIKYRPAGMLERSYWFQIPGFLIFFWFTAFLGHVEPQWTIACSIPMIIILSGKCFEDKSLLRFTKRYIFPAIGLILLIRILMMTDLRFVKKMAFSGKEVKYKAIETEAKDLPVIFSGAFQRPSLYTFYTGRESMVISSLYSRQTQFDIWQLENKYHNKPAFICMNQKRNSQIYVSDTLQFGGFMTDSLQTVNRMKIKFSLPGNTFYPGDRINFAFSLYNPYIHDIDFGHSQFPVEFCIVFLKGEEIHAHQGFPVKPLHIVTAGATVEGEISALIPELPAGNYHFGLSLNNLFGPSLNSHFIKIKIGRND